VLRHGFAAAVGSVTAAKAAAEGFLGALAAHRPPAAAHAAEDVLLVVAELVTNAVRHAGGRGELRMDLDGGRVRVVVADRNPSLPRPREGRLDGSGGLGWHLMTTLTDSLTVTASPHGKEIHAHVPWSTARSGAGL